MIIQTFAPEYYICFFNMDTTKTTAVLFDFDGVVMDTETQYSVFWHKAGVDYLGMDDLESRIKGQTMTYIYDTFFAGKTKEQQEITAALNAFARTRVSNHSVCRCHASAYGIKFQSTNTVFMRTKVRNKKKNRTFVVRI